MKSRIEIIPGNCKICGKSISTTNRSIHGLDTLKKKIGLLCEACAKDEGVLESINNQVGKAIIAKRVKV